MSVHLLKEIEKLKKMILALCASAEKRVQEAVDSVRQLDPLRAENVVEGDIELDHAEVEIEEEGLKILALHQPVAIDLRFIIATLKINSDLERIGDLAVNIAQQVPYLTMSERASIPFDFPEMAKKAQRMLRDALNALVNLDAALAREVCAADDEVDALNREMYDRVKETIAREPERVDSILRFLTVCRNLERIADHATNIAEDVIYMVEGKIIRHTGADHAKQESEK